MFHVDRVTGTPYWTHDERVPPQVRGKRLGSIGVVKKQKGPNGKIYAIAKPRRHRRFQFKGKSLLWSRVQKYLATGKEPGPMTDHANGVTLDDNPHNLIDSNALQNAWNRKPAGRVEYVGVAKSRNKYRARLFVGTARYVNGVHTTDRITIHLGTFETAREAGIAYAKEAVRRRGMAAGRIVTGLLREEDLLDDALAAHRLFLKEKKK
jgi:hypothetical protein